MTALDRLLRNLEMRGLTIEKGDEPEQLILKGPANEKTPEVIEAVKAFKPLLLKKFSGKELDEVGSQQCPQCLATWFCPLDEIRLAVQSPHYCATPQCPYRQGAR